MAVLAERRRQPICQGPVVHSIDAHARSQVP